MNEKEEYNFGAYAKSLRKDIADYVDARIEYTKLSAYEQISQLVSQASIVLLLLIFSFFSLFFISFMAAVFIDQWLQLPGVGYAIVAVLNIIFILIVVKKKAAIKAAISGKVIEQLLKDHEENKSENDSVG